MTSSTRRSLALGMGTFLLVPNAWAVPIGIAGFSKFARKQKTAVWCWAAVLQTLLNYKGIPWTQEDIVAAIKGKITVDTATDLEISQFLNGWGFSYGGQVWKASSIFSSTSPSPEVSVAEFRAQRPIILKLRLSPVMDHVVIAYVANVEAGVGRPDQLKQIYDIDPFDGEIHLMTGQQYVSDVRGYWLIDVKTT